MGRSCSASWAMVFLLKKKRKRFSGCRESAHHGQLVVLLPGPWSRVLTHVPLLLSSFHSTHSLYSSHSLSKTSITNLQFSSFSHTFHPQFFSNSWNLFLFLQILHKSFFFPQIHPKFLTPLPLFRSQIHPFSTFNSSSNFTKIPFLTSISVPLPINSPNLFPFSTNSFS